MKKTITLVAMLLIFAASYAQDKYPYKIGDTRKMGDKTYVLLEFFDAAQTKPRWVSEEYYESSIEEKSNSTAEASSATAVNGFTFEQMMAFASMLSQNHQKSSGSMEDLMKMMLFLKQLQGDGSATSSEKAYIASLEAKVDALQKTSTKSNKIAGAGLGIGIGDLLLDAASFTFQMLDRRGGNGNGFTRGNNQTRGRTDWGYGDVIRTGTNQGRTPWNNGR